MANANLRQSPLRDESEFAIISTCAPPGELALAASHSIGGDSCFKGKTCRISYNFSKAAALADLYACVSIQMSLRHTTLFSAMSLCAWLLRQVRPESQWRERVKTLLDDYSDVSLSAMGFPDDWREYALWK